MLETGMSGLMSGEVKRSDAEGQSHRALPRLYSRLDVILSGLQSCAGDAGHAEQYPSNDHLTGKQCNGARFVPLCYKK